MKEITSIKNPLIKDLKKLHKRKYRELENKYLIEGFHLVEEAFKSEAEVNWVIVTNKGLSEWGDWVLTIDTNRVLLVSEEIIETLSDLPTPQGIIGVVTIPKLQQSDFSTGGWLLLDNVQDPGNVGTMIRTADAAGLAGVVIGKGTADIYSTKVLRSMQGSNYHLPIIHEELSEVLSIMQKLNIPVFGTELNDEAIHYKSVEPLAQYGLIMGNEGQGVKKELLKNTTQNLYIPIKGAAESLNVAVAAGVLMFHLEKQ